MRRWTKNAALILTINVMLSWSVCATAEPGTTVVDSLVWDIQHLERELVQCQIQHTAETDTLKHQLRVMTWDLEAARDREMSWYEKPAVWFLLGAAASTLVIASTVKISF